MFPKIMNLLSKLFRNGPKSDLILKLRHYRVKRGFKNVELSKIRNIGIMAHIDAGKTTTTERMLYYSGLIEHMGEVHHGNTVTDYMSQERERGITITSAAVTFPWKNHQFNLIDTPGHIDFTMEVEQTLSVLDGAIVVLDGSAGVEAQTLTVWRQAEKYRIPRIIFINKMDRADASLELSCKSIENKLEMPTIRVQLPLIEKNRLVGVLDILNMEKIKYDAINKMSRENLTEGGDPENWSKAKSARACVVDDLTEFSDDLANIVIKSSSLDDIQTGDIIKALAQATFNKQAVPVLIGSAYKNIGIEPLMDAIILFLPSPNEGNRHFECFEENLCARAFKIKHDKQKGALVFFRIYNGTIGKDQRIYDIQKEKSEQISRLYIAYADDFNEVNDVQNGNIAVAAGLKLVTAGDLITNSQSSMKRAKSKMLNLSTKNNFNQNSIENLFSGAANVPEPVFFCSIEPPSAAYQPVLEQALKELQREDPSLRVTYDSETGQTVLSGMGELHLEIIKDRILKEYKVNAELGSLQIAYREAPINNVTDILQIETKIGSSKQSVNIQLTLIPTKNASSGDCLKFDKSAEASSHISSIYARHLAAIKQGIHVGLSHGPKIGLQVVNAEVILHMCEVGRGTTDSFITATVTQLVQKLLKESGSNILEPVMFLEVVTPDGCLSSIMADLSRRRSMIQNVALRGNMKVVTASVPLSELLGYSTVLRTISSGTATFTMEYSDYQAMSALDESAAIQSVRGF